MVVNKLTLGEIFKVDALAGGNEPKRAHDLEKLAEMISASSGVIAMVTENGRRTIDDLSDAEKFSVAEVQKSIDALRALRDEIKREGDAEKALPDVEQIAKSDRAAKLVGDYNAAKSAFNAAPGRKLGFAEEQALRVGLTRAEMQLLEFRAGRA